MKILIVEDEESIVLPLKKILEKNNFTVDYALDGEEGLSLASINVYNCIILDLNLPNISGMEIATKLRENKNDTPILMLTARSQIYDKLEGFKTGADDYVTKPFNTRELLARINAIIKRTTPNKNPNLKVGDLELIPDKNIAVKNKKEIELSNKETAVLEYLIRYRGQVVSSEELLDHVWESDVNIFSDTVKTHIKTLRKKVDHKKQIIKTIRGKGYLIE